MLKYYYSRAGADNLRELPGDATFHGDPQNEDTDWRKRYTHEEGEHPGGSAVLK